MGERSIRTAIAGRSYPLTVDAKEEPRIARAATLINERVQQLESTYAVKDKQDLEAQAKVVDDHESLLAELDGLEALLDVHLAQASTTA
jgi:cell division protein ZapA (FtsZ GTPase activity inhibitor)